MPGQYRFAMKPGMSERYGNPGFYHIECLEHVLVLSSPGILPRIYPEFEGNQLLDGGAKLTVEWISTHKTTDYGVTPPTEEHSTVKQAVDVRTWAIRAAQEEESTSAAPATDTADMESRPSAEEKSNLTKSKEGESSEDEGATMTPERPTSSAQTQNGFDNKDASERVLSPSAVGPRASTRSGNLGPTGSSSQSADPVSRESTKCDNNNNADSRSDVLDDVRYGLSRALNAWIERKTRILDAVENGERHEDFELTYPVVQYDWGDNGMVMDRK